MTRSLCNTLGAYGEDCPIPKHRTLKRVWLAQPTKNLSQKNIKAIIKMFFKWGVIKSSYYNESQNKDFFQ